MQIRGLVFDLFGTLVTRNEGWRAYRELIRSLPPWKWRWARRVALTQAIPTIREFHAHVGLRHGPGPEHFERLLEQGLEQVELHEDTLRTLERARARGLRLALLSNLAAPYREPVYEFGLDALFDELVFSCEVGMLKPEPKIYAYTADKLGLPPAQLLMIGDTRREDVRGPRAAGLHALHIDRHRERGDLRTLDELFEHPLLAGGETSTGT